MAGRDPAGARKMRPAEVCPHPLNPSTQRAFIELIRDCDRKLYGLALRVAPTPEDAEDVVQEALLKAYEHLPEFEGKSSLLTWVCRIVLNEGYRKQRRRGADREILPNREGRNGDTALMSAAADPERSACEQQLRTMLNQAIENMPARYRSLFIACVVEGHAVETVAARSALPVEVVRQRLVRARVWLRETLLPCSRSCTQYSSGCIARPCRDAVLSVALRRDKTLPE